MRKELFTLALFLLASYTFSQQIRTVELPRGSRTETTEVINGISTHNYSAKSDIPINGIPFLKAEFQSGILELHDGKRSGEVMLRYNIAKDLFEILRDNDTLTLNRPYAVKYVYLDDKVFMFNSKLREKAKRNQNGYFQQRVIGDLSLFIKRRKDLSFDSFATNYQGGSGTKEYYYVDRVSFVGKAANGHAFLISSSKNLLANLEEHKAEIRAFIKANRIKFKNEVDIVKVVEYYNSL